MAVTGAALTAVVPVGALAAAGLAGAVLRGVVAAGALLWARDAAGTSANRPPQRIKNRIFITLKRIEKAGSDGRAKST